MKLILNTDRIAATATDDYTGPDIFIDAPPDFDPERLSDYRVIDGQVILPPPAPVTTITMRQCRLQLLAIGLLDDVDAAISAITDEAQRRAAQIEWEYAAVVDRHSDWVQTLAGALGLTDEQLDALFSEAAKL